MNGMIFFPVNDILSILFILSKSIGDILSTEVSL
jgi:hypothetical protein